MTAKAITVPISERALVQRINRALAKDGETLRKARSAQTAASVGEYFILDTTKNSVARTDVDLVALGRKLKVLAPYERVKGN